MFDGEFSKFDFPASTDRLVLRPHAAEDWAAILSYSQVAEYREFLPIDAPTEQSAKAFVAGMIANRQAGYTSELNVAVCLRSSGQLIGDVRLNLTERWRREAHLGFGLDSVYWGRGLGAEAVRSVIGAAWASGIERIGATCDLENGRSEALLRRVGFKEEGILRGYLRVRGKRRDCRIFGLLANDPAG